MERAGAIANRVLCQLGGERMSGERGAHTPGEWFVAQDTLDGRLSFPVVDDQGLLVAHVVARDVVRAGFGKHEDERTHSANGQPEAWANAHLIAKASRMAALLDEVVEVLESVRPDHRGPGCWCQSRDVEHYGHEARCERARALLSRLKREEATNAD